MLMVSIVTVPPQTPYMVLNTSQQDFSIEFVEDTQTHEIIYDPYLMEYVIIKILIPMLSRKNTQYQMDISTPCLNGIRLNILTPDFNYIFVRPGLGMSTPIT